MDFFMISILLFSNVFVQISTTAHASSQKAKTRKSNSQYDECVCFPTGQSLVPELMDPEENGLERLVVFFYRDVYTNQITMFLPSKERQPLIPNIPFEVGDILKTVTTETIQSLFFINPNIAGNGDQPFIEGLPIGLNWGKIRHNRSPNVNYFDILQGYLPQNNPQQIYWPNVNSPKQYQQPFVPNNQVNYEVINTGQYVYPWGAKNPYQTYKTYLINLPRQARTQNQHLYITPGENAVSGQLTFDQWFNQQMVIFQDTKPPQYIKSININILRSLVQKTLFDNHMHIEPTGLITDANGALINLNNLELRPIMIGNAVTYPQALKGDPHLALPKHLPYLEGLLITLVYPPKILGVIPLGKTYVSENPQPSSTNTLIEHYYNDVESVPKTISVSNYINPYSSASQQNNQWIYPSSASPSAQLYKMPTSKQKINSRPQPSNFNLAFYAGAGIPNSSSLNSLYTNNFFNPLINSVFKRRSNQAPTTQKPSKESKQKAQQKPKIVKEKLESPSLPVINSRNGRKSGRPTDGNWQSSLNSEFYSAPQNSLYSKPNEGTKSHITALPLGDQWHASNTNQKYYPDLNNSPYSWSSASNSVPSQYKPSFSSNSLVKATPINQVPNIASEVIATPYINPNQNLHSSPYVQPVSASFPSTNTNLKSFSSSKSKPYSNIGNAQWHPLITSTFPFSNSPGDNPYRRAGPTSQEGEPKSKITAPSDFKLKYLVADSPTLMQNETRPAGGTRRFPLPVIEGVIKSLINMVMSNLSGESKADSSPAPEGGGEGREAPSKVEPSAIESNVNIVNNIQKTGEIEEGERPDYRIIGGSAATGSGSPVSNKGRSGDVSA